MDEQTWRLPQYGETDRGAEQSWGATINGRLDTRYGFSSLPAEGNNSTGRTRFRLRRDLQSIKVEDTDGSFHFEQIDDFERSRAT